MKRLRFAKSKLRLIYTSPATYLMLFLQISFLVIYIYAYRVNAVSDYYIILKKDFFLWFICIPSMVVQHKGSIYSTYYSCVARICSKRRMILADYITMAAATSISTGIVLSVPLFFLFGKGTLPVSQEISQEIPATFFFLLTRYILLGLLIQYILYSILYAVPNLQKRGGSICALPFLLYFVFTSPMEILRIKGQYVPILDFSASGHYGFAMDSAVSWSFIFSGNLHLVGCLALAMGITICYASKRWEFWENESVGAL